MVKLKRVKQGSVTLDLVPMINIVFLLLIFFMLTSTAIINTREIDLPKAQTGEEIKQNPLIISVFATGKITLNGEPVQREDLLLELQKSLAAKKNKLIEIHADRNISLEVIGEIIESAKNIGIVDYILATRQSG